MAAQKMTCKLDTQTFEALAPLSKEKLFGYEEFFLKKAEEVRGEEGVIACSVP